MVSVSYGPFLHLGNIYCVLHEAGNAGMRCSCGRLWASQRFQCGKCVKEESPGWGKVGSKMRLTGQVRVLTQGAGELGCRDGE